MMESVASLLNGLHPLIVARLIISVMLIVVPLIILIIRLIRNRPSTISSSEYGDGHNEDSKIISDGEENKIMPDDTDEQIDVIDNHSISDDEDLHDTPPVPEANEELIRESTYREQFRSDANYLSKRAKREEYEKKLIEGYAHDNLNKEVIFALADYYTEHNKSKKALPLLKHLIDSDPEDHKALRKISELYFDDKQYDTAEILINQSLAVYPENPKYMITLVEIYYNTGRIDDAIDMMEKVVQLRPSRIGYRDALAKLYEQVGDYDLVEDCYHSMLQLEPNNTEIKKKLLMLSKK